MKQAKQARYGYEGDNGTPNEKLYLECKEIVKNTKPLSVHDPPNFELIWAKQVIKEYERYNKPCPLEKHCRVWTDEERRLLREHYPNEGILGMLKYLPSRTEQSIQRMAMLLDIKKITSKGKTIESNPREWNEAEDRIIREHIKKHGKVKRINEVVLMLDDRKYSAIYNRAHKIYGKLKKKGLI